mgnify:CR=1 FL=1
MTETNDTAYSYFWKQTFQELYVNVRLSKNSWKVCL